MPQGGYRGAEELGTGTRNGDKATKPKPKRADTTLYRTDKGGLTGFDGDKTVYGRPGVSDPFGLSKAQNEEINAEAARSQQMAQDVAKYAVIGANVGTRANRLVNEPTPPIQQSDWKNDAIVKRRLLDQQIANEQKTMLRSRRARGGSYGDGGDAKALERIAELRGEKDAYGSSLTSVKRPNSPEANVFAAREASNQAAKIMQSDIPAMEQRVYSMPAGPARDAAAEQLRAFKYRANEEFVKGNVLRPEDVGPRVEGSRPDDYYKALAEGDHATAGQVRSAGMQYDINQERYGYAKSLTDKRMLNEQNAQQEKDTIRQAGLDAINRPQAEFKLRQDQAAAELAQAKAKAESGQKLTDAQIAQLNAQTEKSRYEMNPDSPQNRLANAQVDQFTREAQRRANVAEGKAPPSTPEEIAQAQAGRGYSMEQAGITPELQANAMRAVEAIKASVSAINNGEVSGSAITGNVDSAAQGSKQIMQYAQSIRDLAKSDPVAARNMARDFLANLPTTANGEYSTGRSASNIAAHTIVGPLTAGIGNAAMDMAFRSNRAARELVANNMNNATAILRQIAGQ